MRGIVVVALLYLFLVGVKGLGAGFTGLSESWVRTFLTATHNPFVGLMIGILATSLVQSPSVTTAMIVSLVAAPENALEVQYAVPMITGGEFAAVVPVAD